jgi:hypothetical protein
MPPVGFEPVITAGERPETCALDRAATGTGKIPNLNSVVKRKNNYEKGLGIMTQPILFTD